MVLNQQLEQRQSRALNWLVTGQSHCLMEANMWRTPNLGHVVCTTFWGPGAFRAGRESMGSKEFDFLKLKLIWMKTSSVSPTTAHSKANTQDVNNLSLFSIHRGQCYLYFTKESQREARGSISTGDWSDSHVLSQVYIAINLFTSGRSWQCKTQRCSQV